VSDLKEIFKQAAEIAQQVPENMKEAAFNRALDLLTIGRRKTNRDDEVHDRGTLWLYFCSPQNISIPRKNLGSIEHLLKNLLIIAEIWGRTAEMRVQKRKKWMPSHKYHDLTQGSHNDSEAVQNARPGLKSAPIHNPRVES
jgi:hypothetical protein